MLQKILTDLGFKFSFENSDPEEYHPSKAGIMGINDGLKDVAEGRVFSHEDAMDRINKKLLELRRNGGE